MSNAEANTKGHFYEARFGSRELVDEAGILCCSIYVDLNQLKAGISTSLAESDNSAIQDRILAWQQREADESVKKFYKERKSDDDHLKTRQVLELLSDCHLAPIDDNGPLMMPGDSAAAAGSDSSSPDDGLRAPDPEQEQETDQEAAAKKVQPKASVGTAVSPNPSGNSTQSSAGSSLDGPASSTPSSKPPPRKIHRRLARRRRPRASENAILSMSFQQYLQIAEWTAEQVLTSGTDPPPEDLESLLRAKELDPVNWQSAVNNFADWFHHAVGKSTHLTELLQRRGRKWIHGITGCRDAFT